MYVSQNNITHTAANAAVVERFTVEPIRDRRGIWRTTRKRMFLRGTIVDSTATQATILAALDTLSAAYSGDNFDIALYHDDGTRSHYYLTSSGSLGGVKVVLRDFPALGDDPSQYCTGVDYRIVCEAEYPANELSPMEWQERLEFVGNGGPRYDYYEPVVGPPVRYIAQQRTLQLVVQSGSALGLSGYPLVADPIWPQLELPHLRKITPTGPTNTGANLRYAYFGMAWSYTFLSPTPLSGLPNFR